MEKPDITSEELLRGKLNSETARIPWKELQRYFAGGYTLLIDQQLDLIDVAYQFSKDNAEQTAEWLNAELIRPVNNDEARRWFNNDEELWACVVKPWVLLQTTEDLA